jgi:hypothetical protein
MKNSVIHKHEVPLERSFDILLHPEAEVLSVHVQNGVPQIWVRTPAAESLDYSTHPRLFYLYGTGYPVDEDAGRFIGTFQLNDGRLVLHLFEGKR